MGKGMRSIIALLLVVLVVAPPLTACDGLAARQKPLKIGMITPSTGPAAEKGLPMEHANLDAIEYINNELGGVGNEVKLEAVWADSAYDASKTAAIVNQFMKDRVLLFTVASSKEMSAVRETANRAGFPGIAAFAAPSLYRPPQHVYGQMPDYGDDALAFADYFMKNIWKGKGKPRFALLLLNNPTGYGARDAFKAKADELGIEVVAIEEHIATTSSEIETLLRVNSERETLIRIKSKNPDVIYISSTPAPAANIVKNAYELRMYPGVTIGLGHASLTKAFIDLAGPNIAEGVYGVYPTVSWGEAAPGMAKMTEYVRKLHPADEGNMDYISSWAQTLIVAEIVRTALKNVGYDVLAKGGPDAWKAVETQGIQKLQDYQVEGLHGPVTYSPGDNRLSKAVRVFQVRNGRLARLTDWTDAPMVKYEEFPWWKP